MTVVPMRQREVAPVEDALLQLQRVQQAHDELAHRDILSFNLHTRLKHMVLHFYKYAGKIERARDTKDLVTFRATLIDTYIICMASANAVNISLGQALAVSDKSQSFDVLAKTFSEATQGRDLFGEAVSQLVIIGGQMAKVLESADHMEAGDPRTTMGQLIPQLAQVILSILGHLGGNIENDIRARLRTVEQKSIFSHT